LNRSPGREPPNGVTAGVATGGRGEPEEGGPLLVRGDDVERRIEDVGALAGEETDALFPYARALTPPSGNALGDVPGDLVDVDVVVGADVQCVLVDTDQDVHVLVPLAVQFVEEQERRRREVVAVGERRRVEDGDVGVADGVDVEVGAGRL